MWQSINHYHQDQSSFAFSEFHPDSYSLPLHLLAAPYEVL